MTKDDMIGATSEDTTKRRPILGQILLFVGVSLFGGGLAAMTMIFLRDGFSVIALVVGGAFSAIGALLTFAAIKVGDFEPPSLKTRAGRSQLILLVCVVLGMIIGFYANVSGAADRFMDGDFSLSRAEAIAALILIFGIALPVGLYWQREIDEHERAAAKDAAYIALNVYVYGYIGMVIAASAGLIPWISGPSIFFIVLTTFLLFWIIKRSG